MHPHFRFSLMDVLWTLTFAAHLVLLVVLMGRDRIRRFPFFTASVVMVAFRLLISKLLLGRMPQMTVVEIVIVTAAISVIITLLVLLELARKAFGRVRRATWITGSLIVMAIGAIVVRYWGVWPKWQQISHGSPWQLLQLMAQKGSLFADVETILLGFLIVAFGYRYGAGWRTHTQRIIIGLSTASIGQLAVQGIWQAIASHAAPKSMDEYNHLIAMREHLFNANSMLFIAILVWWIVTLWIDEPGMVRVATPEGTVIEGDRAPVALQSGSAEVIEEPDPKDKE